MRVTMNRRKMSRRLAVMCCVVAGGLMVASWLVVGSLASKPEHGSADDGHP